jgi:sulfur carrier protein ThiS
LAVLTEIRTLPYNGAPLSEGLEEREMPKRCVSKKVTVKITLFPPFSRKTIKDETTMTFEGGSTVKDLIDYLISSNALIIHNDHIASLNDMVRDGDSLKFLHPLQGG